MKHAGQTIAALLVVAGIGAALLDWSIVGTAKAQDDLAPGPDQDLVSQTCTGCHAANVFTAMRLDAGQWGSILDEMAGMGATFSDSDREKILSYLTANYAAAAPAAPATTAPAVAAPAVTTPPPDAPPPQ